MGCDNMPPWPCIRYCQTFPIKSLSTHALLPQSQHTLKYLYVTKDDGIYFWRTAPRQEFKEGPLPVIHSNKQALLMNRDFLEVDANILHAYADLDWATCPKTRHSFGGACLRLAGGTIACKYKFQPTIAGLSTEAKFMAVGKESTRPSPLVPVIQLECRTNWCN
jgi:hypothetical protein